ncbi:MAG: crossover junction endodeoxyribonuclease RuvC [Gammaproteobacteria bacterium]
MTAGSLRILGIDPGSRITGFGIVDVTGARAVYVTSGAIRSGDGTLGERMREIFLRTGELMAGFMPAEIAIERVFVSRNVDSALKLGHARAAALCATFASGVPVHEYAPREIKLAVVGRGGAQKTQVEHMVRALLGLRGDLQADAADALAVALCHANARSTRAALARATPLTQASP